METNTEKKYRRSAQREKILAHLHGRHDHPTAMTIFTDLKPMIPTLSLGNLYRNLGILLEQRKIIKVHDNASQEDRFDGQVSDHFHFHCTACHKLFDLPADGHPDLRASIAASGAWQIQNIEVNLAGRCPDCAKS